MNNVVKLATAKTAAEITELTKDNCLVMCLVNDIPVLMYRDEGGKLFSWGNAYQIDENILIKDLESYKKEWGE